VAADLLPHIRERLDGDGQTLLADLKRRPGLTSPAHASAKPHLPFCPAEPLRVPPHLVLQAVRERGCHAWLVEL
jgi:hypothetical protein